MPHYKPEGYNTASPYLIVQGADATMTFLKRAFDAVELRRFADDEGRVLHAEVRLDDSVIMLADPLPPEWVATPCHMHVYVKDVDQTYKRALDAGATSVQEPVKKEDADKRGAIKDAGGTTWWIATRVE